MGPSKDVLRQDHRTRWRAPILVATTFNPEAPGSPTPVEVDRVGANDYALYAIACPSTTQCTAVDNDDQEITFNPQAPGTPLPVQLDPSNPVPVAGLNSIACPSTTQCTAVDNDDQEITFNPSSPTSAVAVNNVDSVSGDLTAAQPNRRPVAGYVDNWNRAVVTLAGEYGDTCVESTYRKSMQDVTERRSVIVGDFLTDRNGEDSDVFIGHDIDRDAPRTFRLDRIVGRVLAV